MTGKLKLKIILVFLGAALLLLSACGRETSGEEIIAETASPEVYEAEEDYLREVWDYLVAQYGNQYAAAALMGNSDFEMAICPYRTESDKVLDENGGYPFSLEYTEKVDSGEIDRENFAHAGPAGGGYGLFAWTSAGRKLGLYDLAGEYGVSISDWRMQLDYAYNEITARYYPLYCTLMTADNIYDATWAFGYYFEQPSDYEISVPKRVAIAQKYYDMFADHAFICENVKDTLLPVNGSFDYMDRTYEENSLDMHLPVYMAQVVMKKMGYLSEEPSGYLGINTADALEALQFDNNLELTRVLDSDVWDVLYAQRKQ